MRNLSQILAQLADELRAADPDPAEAWHDLAEALERFSKWQERPCDCQCVRERRHEIMSRLTIVSERNVVLKWLRTVRDPMSAPAEPVPERDFTRPQQGGDV
jgi:hypothetical protein